MSDQYASALAFDGQLGFGLGCYWCCQKQSIRHKTWHTATANLRPDLEGGDPLLASNSKGDERLQVEITRNRTSGRIGWKETPTAMYEDFVSNYQVALELNAIGKLDVAGGSGHAGQYGCAQTLR